MQICIKPVNDLNRIQCMQLVDILNNDFNLRNSLGCKNKIEVNDFINGNRDWCISKNADMFAILLSKSAIGTISLSHQNLKEQSARVGYWISSDYWRRGYTSEAFIQILKFAKKKGIKCVSASIKEDNFPSKRIWQKNGANIYLENGRFQTKIFL